MPSSGRPAAAANRRHLTERHVLALGLAVSALFVIAAAVTMAWTTAVGGSAWSALHLAMAGAATVAIGAVMPHFAVTLAGVAPSSASSRLAVIGALAAGAATVVVGVTARIPELAALATVLVVAGLGGVAAQTLAPLRDPLARRHPIASASYAFALAELAAGVILGGMAATGVDAVISAWATLRPAHAWLALFGGISLTIAATLAYLAPTVLGARIRADWALAVMLAGIGTGPPVAALGFALAARPLVASGVLLTLAGATGQLAYVARVWRRRGRFSSEGEWRAVAAGHLVAGTGWFLVAVAAAFVELASGRPLPGWSVGILALPLVAGWMLQELVGSWTHLVPAGTPGGPDAHAFQRRILGAGGRVRLAAWNAGLLVTTCGAWLGLVPIAALGGLTLLAAIAASVALLVRALAIGSAR